MKEFLTRIKQGQLKMKSIEAEKKKVSNVNVVLGISIIAILIVSLTIGKDIYEGRNQTLTSFSIIHFSGYLFFILMPVEMVFLYYLTFYDEVFLVWVAIVTSVTAQFIDYFIGYSIRLGSVTRIAGEKKILKAEKYIKKYGNLTIFFFNLLPLSSPVISLAAGILRYNLKDLFVFSFSGLLLKYIILCLVANWFL